MKERVLFISEWEQGNLSMTALCRKFGISRQTGYKWVRRYQELGCCAEALTDLSRAPNYHPWTTPPELVDLVIRARKKWPRWGPQKLHDWLAEKYPELQLPAPSTMGRILKRHGMTKARHRRRRTPPSEVPLAHCNRPNAVVCADFKGHFRTRDGTVCYPLTIMDAHSRFLMRCEALTSTAYRQVREVFESVFDEYGLPDAIRTDNGSPFATRAAGGLSELSAWWTKLGIRHERIEPGHPEQNGRHERMHRTLGEETASPPREDIMEQQRAFDRFRRQYNEERPHQALQGRRPAEVYVASQRELSTKEPRMEYPFAEEVLTIDKQGFIQLGRRKFYVSKTLRHEPVALEPIDIQCWEVYFGPVFLGLVDYSQPRRELSVPRQTWREKCQP